MEACLIWDCFMFINEYELAEIRFRHLEKHVDRFIVVEGSLTHSGRIRGFAFDKAQFPWIASRITVVQALLPDSPDRWVIENCQRNAILQGLAEAYPDDIALVSDCDEIPSHHALEAIREGALPMAFQMKTCGWYVNLVDPAASWIGTVAVPVEQLRAHSPQHYRRNRFGFPRIHRGGFHFTFMGGLEKVAYKIGAFAHAEYDTPENKDLAILAARRDRAVDPMGLGGFHGQDLDLGDPDFPPYLRENRSLFPDLFK